MPYLPAAACIVSESCPAPVFPTTSATCSCDLAVGGINELYFIPCSEDFTQANITNPDWYAGLIAANTFGRSGVGLGSIGKKGTKSERVGSCRTEQITQITWSLKFVIKCFDKTSARTTCAQLNELIANFNRYLVIARMCDGDDVVLPIGVFTTSDFDWVVPDNFEENQNATYELSWIEFGFPCTVDVAGLSAVLPKLS